MRLSAIGLILALLMLLSTGCENADSPAETGEAPRQATVLAVSPQPTPEIGVTFVTVTPGSGIGSSPPETSSPSQPSPEPTETPPATAAPRLYIVQAGDTLVGIANAHGITLNELLALNPDVQPELLLVGQEIFLPPEGPLRSTEESPQIQVTGMLLSLAVAGLSTYRSMSGGLWVLGEVRNAGQQASELVQVAVTLRSPDDAVVDERILWLTPVTIPAGAQAPFGVLLPDAGPEGASASAEIIAGRPVFELGNRYLDLAVTAPEVTIGSNPIEVSGRLRNVGQRSAGQISIVTTFYDERDRVTGFHEMVLEGVIAPGEELPFRFTALPPGGRTDNYAFAIQAVAEG